MLSDYHMWVMIVVWHQCYVAGFTNRLSPFHLQVPYLPLGV